MSDDWQKGDLALCVNVSPVPYEYEGKIYWGEAGFRLRPGRIYNVIRVYPHPRLGSPTLVLAEDASNGAGAFRFRKIRPHTPDAEDAETIRLYQGQPVKEPT